jgi:hypothetical protein
MGGQDLGCNAAWIRSLIEVELLGGPFDGAKFVTRRGIPRFVFYLSRRFNVRHAEYERASDATYRYQPPRPCQAC